MFIERCNGHIIDSNTLALWAVINDTHTHTTTVTLTVHVGGGCILDSTQIMGIAIVCQFIYSLADTCILNRPYFLWKNTLSRNVHESEKKFLDPHQK